MKDNREAAAARADLLQATIAYIEAERRLCKLPYDAPDSRVLTIKASRAINREGMDAAYDRLVAATQATVEPDYIEGRRV